MKYNLRFKIDVKKNVYISKKAVGAEPYYQISAIITINKKRINYFTGFSAQKSVWFNSATDAKKGDGNRTYGVHRGCNAKKGTRIVPYSDVNKALDVISATMLTLSTLHEEINKEVIVETLDSALGKALRIKNQEMMITPKPELVESTEPEEVLYQFWALAELYCVDTLVSNGRNKTRVNAINHLRRFEQYRGKEITFPDCNAKLLTDFNAFLNNDEGDNDTTLHPRHKARKKNRNTIAKIMTCIKQFFRWCRKQYGVTEYGNIDDYSVPTPRYSDPIIVSLDEKRQLWEAKFEEESLAYTRDLFYFQCSIGCRVSDFFNLKYENLINEGEHICIYYTPVKTSDVTGMSCRIPLSNNALAIFNKYKIDNATPNTPLFYFPKHSQVYNRQLKRMFKAAGLNRLVATYNTENQQVMKPLYEVAISKLARSCFIDGLVGKGVTDNIIGTMSGHISGSKAFHRYHNRQKAQQQNQAIALLD